MISPDLVKLVNIARGWAAKSVPGFDDAQWRLILRNIGNVREDATGHVSSKSLDNRTVEQVLAWFESVGWQDRKHGPTYWTAKAQRYSRYQITDSEIHMIEKLAAQQPYELAGIIGRLTNHRTTDIQQLSASEAFKVKEALKSIVSREGAKTRTTQKPIRQLTPAEIAQTEADELPI